MQDALQLILKRDERLYKETGYNLCNTELGFLYLLNGNVLNSWFLLFEGDKDKAKQYFERRGYPPHLQAFGMGIVAYEEQKYEEAIKFFEESLSHKNYLTELMESRIKEVLEDAKNHLYKSQQALYCAAEDILLQHYLLAYMQRDLSSVVTDKEVPTSVKNWKSTGLEVGEEVKIAFHSHFLQTHKHAKKPGEFVSSLDVITHVDTDNLVQDVTAWRAGLITSIRDLHVPDYGYLDPIGIYNFIPQQVHEVEETKTEPTQPPKAIDPQELADIILRSKNIVAITGPGVSSGSDLEARKELWSKSNREEYVSVWHSYKDPSRWWKLVYDFLKPVNFNPKPNIVHEVLVELEKMGKVRGIITQNVNNLHQSAGSKKVVEMHGSLSHTVCTQCDVVVNTPCADYFPKDREPSPGFAPSCSAFNTDSCLVKNDPSKRPGTLKPNVVLFGELVPASVLKEAVDLASQCDLLVIAGASMDVYPTCELPRVAKSQQDKNTTVVEIRKECRITKRSEGVVDHIVHKHFNKSGRLSNQQ